MCLGAEHTTSRMADRKPTKSLLKSNPLFTQLNSLPRVRVAMAGRFGGRICRVVHDAGNASSSKALELGEGFAFMLQLGLHAAGLGAGAVKPDFSDEDDEADTERVAQSRL